MAYVTFKGIPWYTAENYERFLAVVEDAHLLPATYEQWFRGAEESFKYAERKGERPIRVLIDPEHFQTWCKAQGCSTDVEGRMEFVDIAVSKLAATRARPRARAREKPGSATWLYRQRAQPTAERAVDHAISYSVGTIRP
jgi:hypothetical protein